MARSLAHSVQSKAKVGQLEEKLSAAMAAAGGAAEEAAAAELVACHAELAAVGAEKNATHAQLLQLAKEYKEQMAKASEKFRASRSAALVTRQRELEERCDARVDEVSQSVQ